MIMVALFLPISALAGAAYGITNASPSAEKNINGGYITVAPNAAEGDKVEVTVVPNNGYKLKSLVYSPTPKTVADILPEEFPTEESDASGAPESAWKTIMLDQLCYISYNGSKLFFYNNSGDPDKSFSISTNAVLSADDSGNYIYKKGTVTVIFSMAGEGGTLNSITFSNTANTTWDGTYQASACVAAGTMVTMYNGEQKAIEDLEIGDLIRTFNHENGEISSAPVCFIWESINAANAFTLTFEGGINVTVIEKHGFYSQKENKYVFINAKNAANYIGQHFYNADTNSWPVLKSIKILDGQIDAYAIATSKHLNHLSNGMLSMCDGTFEKITNLFEYDNKMKYDADLKKKDIEKYGLTSLEKVLKYEGFNKADYYDYNLQYLNVALGKGFVTEKWIEALSEYCAINNIYDSFPEPAATKQDKVQNEIFMSVLTSKQMLAAAPGTNKNSTKISANAQGKYIFTMPAQNIIITAVFEKVPEKESPQTGDTNNIAVCAVLLALASIGLAACLIYGKKKKYFN